MKFVPNAASRKAALLVLKTQKNSPQLLFVGGVAGVISGTVLACKATLKLEEVLEETQDLLNKAEVTAADPKFDNYSDEDLKKDKALIYAQSAIKICKLYGPAILVGGAGIAALTQSHRILNRRNAALTVAYKGAEKAFSDYRERVKSAIGEEKEQDIYDGVVTETYTDPETGKKTKTKTKTAGSRYAVLWSELSAPLKWQHIPEYNAVFLKTQQLYANDRLRSKGYLILNDVYKSLGLPETSDGALVGWVWNNTKDAGDNYVDFNLGDWPSTKDYAEGKEHAILLDFNVDGVVYDLIDQRS